MHTFSHTIMLVLIFQLMAGVRLNHSQQDSEPLLSVSVLSEKHHSDEIRFECAGRAKRMRRAVHVFT